MQSLTNVLKKIISPKDSAMPEPKNDEEIQTSKTASDKPVDPQQSSQTLQMTEISSDMIIFRETIYDLIKDIRDPEKPETLEELNVVSENDIFVQQFTDDKLYVKIVFVPTVPHCSLASLIGLCLRQKMTSCFPEKHKLDILVKQGSHETADEVNKQINDKERVAAAMENPNLRELVQKCISEEG